MESVENIFKFLPVESADIPKINLYMDQLLGWFSEEFKQLKVTEREMILTKTMINNYVKSGVVPAPQKKKYNALAIKALIITYHMKNILSMDEIKLLVDSSSIEELYTELISAQKEKIRDLEKTMAKDNDAENEKKVRIENIVSLCAEADLKKKVAQSLIKGL